MCPRAPKRGGVWVVVSLRLAVRQRDLRCDNRTDNQQCRWMSSDRRDNVDFAPCSFTENVSKHLGEVCYICTMPGAGRADA